MKRSRDWFHPSPHGTARERFARIGRALMDAGGGAAGETGETGETSERSSRRMDDDLREFFRNVAMGVRAHDLGDESLYLAEELAELGWSLGGRQKRALALLVLATMISVRQGSSRLPLDSRESSYIGQLVTSLVRAGKLDLDVPGLLADIEALTRAVTLDRIIGQRGDHRPLIVDDACVYQHRMLWCEDELARRLRWRLHLPASAPLASDSGRVDAAMARILSNPPVVGGRLIRLSVDQADAVKRAVRQRLTVISGGPGTGKTAIVVAILRLLDELGETADRIALAAPTGKAAHRMATSIRSGFPGGPGAAARDPSLPGQAAADPFETHTLHRLLGYMPGLDRFRHHENNPLPATTVIVDEASMIDLVLMERLLRALHRDARLILLGDADQLPSVDAGAVLRDLVAASEMTTARGEATPLAVRLVHSYRMDPRDPAGRAILLAANRVNAGDAAGLLGDSNDGTGSSRGRPDSPGSPDSPDSPGSPGSNDSDGDAALAIVRRAGTSELTYTGVELLATGGEQAAVHDLIDRWYLERIAGQNDFARLAGKTYQHRNGQWSDEDRADLDRLFAIYETSRLLTVTRRQSTGSEAINRRLHRRVLADASVDRSPELYPGEPVMMRRNDYSRGLFNGDQGVVVRVAENGGAQRFRVVFPRADSYALFHLDALRSQIELAFAMTVHKSQGSELDEVVLILPAVDLPLLTREMLYTGMTRARRSVVLLGDESLLATAIARPGQRFSGLADKLCAASKEPRTTRARARGDSEAS